MAAPIWKMEWSKQIERREIDSQLSKRREVDVVAFSRSRLPISGSAEVRILLN
jgi:hypothetical protein